MCVVLASACGGSVANSRVPDDGSSGGASMAPGVGDTTIGAKDGSTADVIVTQVSESCALLSDGTGKCWGYNAYGQIGISPRTPYSFTPVTVQGLSQAVRIDARGASPCALLGDGTVRCWGPNDVGELGNGMPPSLACECSWMPVAVVGLSEVLEIASSGGSACALLHDETVSCWGGGVGPQPVDGGTWESYTPVAIPGLSSVMELAGGDEHACARLVDGTVQCWGANDVGQLGDGTTIDRYTPVLVQSLSNVVQIAAGDRVSCARLGDGTVKCWGSNRCGSLGDGTTIDRSTPTPVSGLSGVAQVASGFNKSCALLAQGSVTCWGCGDGVTTEVAQRAAVAGLSDVALVSVGQHACALLRDGTVKCWGSNAYGALGDGTNVDSPVPVQVIDLP